MSETTTTTTISDFLLARIAEDEATAKAAAAGEALLTSLRSIKASAWVPDGEITHIVRWDPARVLAECEAKRRLVELHAIQVERDRQSPFDPATGAERSEWAVDLYCDVCGWVSVACDTLHALASVYADHPDYQQEWRL
jgi:hypothetical protein